MKRKNKDIIQSYLLTVAKYDANIYAKRIITHIVNANQNYLDGEKIGNTIINIQEDLFKNREYTINISDILQGKEDKNYKRVIEAFHFLQNKFIRFDDEDNNHISVPFITGLIVERNKGTAIFSMSKLIYKAFTDFTKGFRKLEFELTLSLTSIYSIRMYELMSGQSEPITYTIEYLKKMFGIENKYKLMGDFIRRIIDPAKEELDSKSPYTFEYTINKQGKKYHSITFFPKFQPQFRDSELEKTDLQKQVSLSWDLDRNVTDYLKYNFRFTTAEIKRNIDLFKKAQTELDFVNFMSTVKEKATDKSNPKGYLINAIKLELDIL